MKGKKSYYPWLIMLSACAISMAQGITSSCSGLFYTPVSEALGVGRGTFTLYVTIVSLITTFLLPFAGGLMRKHDLRVLLTFAILLQQGGFMVFSRFTSLWQFYVIAGLLHGIGNAFLMYLTAPILINTWFKKKVGLLLGIATAFAGIGGAVFNPIGSYFITNYGWQTAYVALGAIGLVMTLPFTIFVVRNSPADVGCQAYGADEVAQAGPAAPVTQLTGVDAATAMKSKAFYLVFIFSAILGIMYTASPHMVSFASTIGFDPGTAATAASCVMIGNIIGKVLYGSLADKIGIYKTATVAVVISVASCAILLACGGNITLLMAGAFVFGMGFAIMTVAPAILVRTVFGQKDYAAIQSRVQMGPSFVASIGVSVYGFLYDATGSYTTGLIVVAVCMALSLVFLAGVAKASKVFASVVNPGK